MEENKETCNKIDKISWSDNQKDLISEKNISETGFIIVKSCLKGAKKEEIKILKVQKPLHPKRSVSLNLPKSQPLKDDSKGFLAKKNSKNNPLLR